MQAVILPTVMHGSFRTAVNNSEYFHQLSECDCCFSTDEAEDPAYAPVYWVGKWVDYSDKYGFGYQLSDNSVGVLFNDLTRLILYQDGE